MLPLILAAMALSCGAPATADAAACQQALREGAIVGNRPVGQGVSGALRITLRFRGAEVPAVFKSADSEVEGYTFHGEKASHYRDSWKHEIAAFELDQLLGLRLVPATVERKVGKERGSLQAWAEGALARFGAASLPADPRRAETYLHAQRFFDYLVLNTDRHIRNVVLGPDWRPVAIDQSIGFHTLKRPVRPLYRFPRGPVEALEKLDDRVLEQRLSRYLKKEEIEGLRVRRAYLLALVRAARAEGRDDAFFDW
jgi:hypothetical protein